MERTTQASITRGSSSFTPKVVNSKPLTTGTGPICLGGGGDVAAVPTCDDWSFEVVHIDCLELICSSIDHACRRWMKDIYFLLERMMFV